MSTLQCPGLLHHCSPVAGTLHCEGMCSHHIQGFFALIVEADGSSDIFVTMQVTTQQNYRFQRWCG